MNEAFRDHGVTASSPRTTGKSFSDGLTIGPELCQVAWDRFDKCSGRQCA